MKKLWLKYKFPLTIFLVWQIILATVIWFVGDLVPKNATFPYLHDLSQYPDHLAVRAYFDGIHYLRIATNGYVDVGSQAFFPLYPLIMRVLSSGGIDTLVVGLGISNISVLVALMVIWNTYSPATAQKIIVLLLCFPVSFYLSMVYTEGFFLLLVSVWVYAIRANRLILAATIAGLASATRVVGVALAVGTAITVVFPYFTGKTQSSWLKGAGLVCISFSGLLLYMCYLYLAYGDPLYFQTVQPLFGQARSDAVILLPQVIWRYLKIVITASPGTLVYTRAVLELVAFCGGTWLIVVLWKARLHLEGTMTFIAMLLPTLTGSLASMPRYIVPLTPLFYALATIKVRTVSWNALIVTFVLLQIAAITVYVSGAFVA